MSTDAQPPVRYRPAPFDPPWYLRNRHVQTIVADLVPRRLHPMHQGWQQAGRPKEIALPDGDRLLAYTHFRSDDPRRERAVVVHLHGLEGSAEANTQKGLSSKAFAAGFHTVRMNFRNCGDTEHLARDLYNGRRTDDLLAVLRWLREEEGFTRLYLTGASLGANLALRALADAGDQPIPGVRGAVAISPPIHMPSCAPAFRRGLNRIYDAFFLTSLKRKLRRKLALSPSGAIYADTVRDMGRLKTLAEFDERVTAPAFGYPSALAYYQDASAADDMDRIRVPTLILHAQDDPILPISMFESRMAMLEGNPHLAWSFPRYGGHVGFYQPIRAPNAPWMDGWWDEDEAIAFLLSLEENS